MPTAAVVALALAGSVIVPPPGHAGLLRAFQTLRAAGLVPVLPRGVSPLTMDIGLEWAAVTRASPPPGSVVSPGSVVRLRAGGPGPLPSPGVPLHHPRALLVPQ